MSFPHLSSASPFIAFGCALAVTTGALGSSIPTAVAEPCANVFGNFGQAFHKDVAGPAGQGTLNAPPGSFDFTPLGSAVQSVAKEIDSKFVGLAVGQSLRAPGTSSLTPAAFGGVVEKELGTGSAGHSLTEFTNSSGSASSVARLPQWKNSNRGVVPLLKSKSQIVQQVTGEGSPNQTVERFGVSGTDLGIMWDSGDGEVLIAFGDTVGNCQVPGTQWRSNILLRSSDTQLGDGIDIDSAVMSADGVAGQIFTKFDPATEFTLIPTAGMSIGNTQYVRYMSVHRWMMPSVWETNYSALAKSEDNGETWEFIEEATRRVTDRGFMPVGVPAVNASYENMQMSAFMRVGDMVYEYLTPAGRLGQLHIARVHESEVEDLDAYEYFTGGSWSTNPEDAQPILRAAYGETSVQYNDYLNKYMLMTTRTQGAVVVFIADSPEGPWTNGTTLLEPRDLQYMYAGFMHPWSRGEDLYYTVTTWATYNTFLVKSHLPDFGLTPN